MGGGCKHEDDYAAASSAHVRTKTSVNQAEKSVSSPAGGAVVQKSDTFFFFFATLKMKASLFSVCFFFFSPKSKTDEVQFIGI